MGRHSRKGPAPKGSGTGTGGGPASGEREAVPAPAGAGRRRRDMDAPRPGPEGHTGVHGMPQARGGHPEHREAGGGWGDWQSGSATGGVGVAQASPQRGFAGGPRVPGPRKEYVDAFDRLPPRRTRSDAHPAHPSAAAGDRGTGQDYPRGAGAVRSGARAGKDPFAPADPLAGADEGAGGGPAPKGSRGRTFTGIAAAAVTTVLAVVVAGQVATEQGDRIGARSTEGERAVQERPDRSEGRPTPPQAAKPPVTPVSYAQLMSQQFPIDPELRASGEFETVPGFDKAPGKGRKISYRIDVERGLGLDAGLFARAVQETLNDDRSWAHGGAMTFERISSGEAEFVITLASPGTTAKWCAMSGLDTTVDNVSCDSASTERVMINAFRWAQGAETYGDDAMLAYRQMLINHEVGHRLGYNHVNCSTPGALAPVMQQQTKTLDIGGVKCRANPWVHPGA